MREATYCKLHDNWYWPWEGCRMCVVRVIKSELNLCK